MPDLGPVELLICLAIVMLIFGPSKLADLGGAMGKSVKSFRHAIEDDDDEEEAADEPRLPTAGGLKRCSECETDNALAALFCAECGHRFTAIEPTPVTSQEPITGAASDQTELPAASHR